MPDSRPVQLEMSFPEVVKANRTHQPAADVKRGRRELRRLRADWRSLTPGGNVRALRSLPTAHPAFFDSEARAMQRDKLAERIQLLSNELGEAVTE
ncbi:MAG: hypothetical protein K0U84_05680 [Actinomycetia bacterium]|nr:hypothetical protein [Actinomycetes bacterium]